MPDKALRDEIDVFVADHLPKDPAKWCARYVNKKKIVHDGLWGTLELRPHEVAILDTPLLQRLRFVRQTGAVYLTYPSAVHSRFEHTLGVLCQAGRMCSVFLNRDDRDQRLDRKDETNIRVAALLHDLGHGPFSHTSEQFFSSLDDVAHLQEEENYSDSGAGEILSSLIIESGPMKALIDSINEFFKTAIDLDLVRQIITGKTRDDQMYLSEFIHGPFDADKLDYMHRDGMFSGLELHVDLDRLYASMDIVSGDVDGQRMRRLAGSIAGTSPLTQVMFNKMLLFTGIYHHHKVRTVDCMIWATFELAMKNGTSIGGVKLERVSDFLKLTDDRMLIPELANDDAVKSILLAIRERRLWKRALVISRRTVPAAMHEEAGASSEGRFAALTQLAQDQQAHIRRRREIAVAIWETAGKPCESHEVWLDVPKLPSMDEARQMWINAPGQEQPNILGDFIPITQWVELYGTHKWQAHVICPEAATKVINRAAQIVLKERFGLEFNDLASRYAHIEV